MEYKEKTRSDYILKVASFFTTSENFLKSSDGLPKFKKTFPFCQRPLVTTSEIIHEECPIVNRFKDAKVLVIGAGPSTLRYNWNWDDYDLVCSTTQFYLNKQIKDHVNFAEMMKSGFEGFASKSKVILCFERDRPFARSFYKRYPDRSILVQMRYWSKGGVAPRLVVMATLFGAREIHVVGADGYPVGSKPNQKTQHAFLGTATTANNHSYDRWKTIYLDLWDYCRYKIGKNVKYVNLGYGHPYNISSLALDNQGNWLNG